LVTNRVPVLREGTLWRREVHRILEAHDAGLVGFDGRGDVEPVEAWPDTCFHRHRIVRSLVLEHVGGEDQLREDSVVGGRVPHDHGARLAGLEDHRGIGGRYPAAREERELIDRKSLADDALGSRRVRAFGAAGGDAGQAEDEGYSHEQGTGGSMGIRRSRWGGAFLLRPGLWTTLAAQQWNWPEALDLAARATEVRAQVQRDSSLRSYRTRAHGFVLFLAQGGAELQGAPRLVKADELHVEVYWRAPDLSKQIILGWRDGRWLPTDINYHRDHLGIVTNNFGNRIRIGEGDEVRDVVHPLSPDGLNRYDFALIDSLRIETRGGELLVYQLQVRPKDWSQPLVVGTLSLDAPSAELVRFRFGFTPAAYLEKGLEDISIMLENARFEDRWWLPYRQEIEIRRRSQWLDFPARGIIRGRWEIGDYDFDAAIPPEVLRGPAIGGMLTAS